MQGRLGGHHEQGRSLSKSGAGPGIRSILLHPDP